MTVLTRTARLARQAALLLAVAVPAVTVMLYLRHDLLAGRAGRAEQAVTRQAALLDADLRAVAEGARQLGVAIGRLPAVASPGVTCAAELRGLLADLPAYSGISVLSAPGQLLCATDPAAVPPSASALRGAGPGLRVGGFAAGPNGPVLRFGVPTPAGGLVVLNLSLAWLARHLKAHSGAAPGGDLVAVTDAQGVILARLPDAAAFVGQGLPPVLLQHVGAAGMAAVTGLDGQRRLIGFSPSVGGRLFVAVGAPVADGAGMADMDRATAVALVLIVLGAVGSVSLALLVSARFVRRPAAALVEAARRWTEGDLGARALLDRRADPEFIRLAAAFNGMAASLGRKQAELQDLNTSLEARVAARTRDLVASRNQLQVQIVEREKTEAELRQAHKLQAVGQLAGGIAHDFNNLLSVVTNALDLLRHRLGTGRPALTELVAEASQAAQRGARLTQQLLAFARRQRLLPAATDLNRMVEELPSLVAGMVGRDIEIRTELAPDLWPALVDPGQLEAALLNLALNARDAMPGGGTLRLSTANVLVPRDLPAGPSLAPGAYVAVRVSDTGTGMAPDVLARVFEPFFTTKPAGGGSGLGLSQVHGLALQSGGDVRIDTQPDPTGASSGTTVTLLLPRAPAPHDPAAPRATTGGLRILVADDDDAVRRMTGEILLERGHLPVLAADAAQALAILEKDAADTGGSFDVLLADYVMPGINGVALILMAQALQPRMQALLVTGHAEFDGAADALRPEDIMRKPFTIAQLDARLARMVRHRAPAPAPARPPEAPASVSARPEDMTSAS